MHAWRRSLAAGAATAALILLTPILPAAAAPEAHGRVLVDVVDIDETYDPEENFCGISGLTVTVHEQTRGRVFFVYRGKDRIPHFHANFHSRTTFTEPDGTTVTIVSNTADHDQRIVDNGDGTFTITVVAAGGFKVIGPDRTLRDPGTVKFQILIDNNGTPLDPFDDGFLDFLGFIKDSTGLNELGEDFCSDYRLLTGRA